MKSVPSILAVVTTLGALADPVCRSGNGVARFTLEEDGTIAISEIESGRETVMNCPLLALNRDDGGADYPRTASVDKETKRLRIGFGDRGIVELSVRRAEGAWLFTCERLTVRGLRSVTFGPLEAVPNRYRGNTLNMMSDDESGVVVRGCDWRDRTHMMHKGPAVEILDDRIAARWSVGVVAAPRQKLIPSLQALTELSGVPVSTAGGAWALESPIANGSYVFADITPDQADRWVEFALQSGISIVHFHGWWETLGHYGISKSKFPGGYDDVRATAKRLHDAGIRTGMHTLSSCIAVPRDPWVGNGSHIRDFITAKTYTLASILTPEAKEMTIREKPDPRQDSVLTYSGNGNVIRIGDELIAYSGIEREPPYRFTGLTRGWAGTKASAHAAGLPAGWLRQRYVAFYPKVGSKMLDELAESVARARDAIGAEMFYFDGMEGCGTWQDMDGTRFTMFKALKSSPLNECSSPTPGTWWFQSRLGTADRPLWHMKRFTENHARSLEETAKANLLRPQMGWWEPRIADAKASGHFWDDMEYFAGRTASIDAVMSLEGIRMDRGPLPFEYWRQVTILGWYERIRRAKAFSPQAMKLLRSPGWEYRLRQDGETGEWRLSPMRTARFKATGLSDGVPVWKFSSPGKARVALRVEALYTTSALAESSGMQISATPLSEPMRFGNAHQKIVPNGAFLMRVTGTGGNQVLHLHAEAAREYLGAVSDQSVPLDFKGEKTVMLPIRERTEVESKAYPVYGLALDPNHISSIDLNITGDNADEIRVGGLWTVPIVDNPIRKAQISVNGEAVEVPFELASGEYAEYEDGVWTKFAAGEVVEVREAKCDAPTLQKGENDIMFTAEARLRPRAEVTVFALAGRGFPALADGLGAEAKKELEFEAMEPVFYSAAKGASAVPPLKVRPNEQAWLSFCLSGDIVSPKIRIGGKEVAFSGAVHPGEQLDCQDGLNWTITNAKCKVVRRGRLTKRLTGLSGVKPVVISSGGKIGSMSLRIVKHYGAPPR